MQEKTKSIGPQLYFIHQMMIRIPMKLENISGKSSTLNEDSNQDRLIFSKQLDNRLATNEHIFQQNYLFKY